MTKTNPDSGNQGHNSKHIKETIRSVADRVIRLQEEKAGIMAVIREAKAEVKGLGIKMADFNAAMRLYVLEDEDRAESVDNMKIAFEALGIGAQGDLFPDAAKPAKPAKKAKGRKPRATGNGAGTTAAAPA